MTDTKGNIRARKLGNTGITEDILKKIADAKGGHLLAIVELKADTIHEQINGDDRTVDFLIDTIEPVVDGKLDGTIVDHVRNIQAALYRNRKLRDDGEQLPLEGDGPEPTVADVLAQGKGLVDVDDDGEPVLWDGNTDPDDDEEIDKPHAFVGDDTRPDGSRDSCVRCGRFRSEDGYIHTDDAEATHPYVDTAFATCGHQGCGRPASADIHTTAPVPA